MMNYYRVLNNRALVLTACLIAFLLNQTPVNAQLNDWSSGFERKVNEHIELLEGIYLSQPPYNSYTERRKLQLGERANTWFRENSSELRQETIIRKYLLVILGCQGYYANRSEMDVCSDLEAIIAEFDAINLATGRGIAQINYLNNRYGLNREKIVQFYDTWYPVANELAYQKSCKEAPLPLDTDGDGIIDLEDACMLVPGPARFQGCADTDEDEIPDHKDKCPLEKAATIDGCPVIIKTPNGPVYVTEEGAKYVKPNGRVIEEDNVARVFKRMIAEGDLNSPFMAYEHFEVGSANYEKFKGSEYIIYSLKLLSDNAKQRILFPLGKYYIREKDEQQGDFRYFSEYKEAFATINQGLFFLRDTLNSLDAVQPMVQGMADVVKLKVNPTPLHPQYQGPNYRYVDYFYFDQITKKFQPRSMTIKGDAFTLEQLPELRAAFILDAMLHSEHFPIELKKDVFIFEGMVTNVVDPEDRHVTMLLAIDWERVEAAAEEWAKRVFINASPLVISATD